MEKSPNDYISATYGDHLIITKIQYHLKIPGMINLFYLSSILLFSLLTACSKSGDNSVQTPASTTSKVVFTNNTSTTVNLTFQGQAYTIATGESLPFVENPNTNLSYSATTLGTFGSTIDFGLHNIISGASGQTNNISLDIPKTYFYLIINNASIYTVRRITFYLSTMSNASFDRPVIANDGKNYAYGYLTSDLIGIILQDQDCFTSCPVGTKYWNIGNVSGTITTPLPTLSGSINQKMILNLQ